MLPSDCFFLGLYPTRVFRQFQDRLLQRRHRVRARSSQCTDLNANYRVGERAEGTHTRLVCTHRIRADLIVNEVGSGTRRSGVCIVVATLADAATVGGEVIVNQAGIGVGWSDGRALVRRVTQVRQVRRIPGCWVAGVERNLGSVDSANAAGRGRLIGRNTRAQQVRNSDRSDDQNDRDPTISNSISEKPFCFRISLFSLISDLNSCQYSTDVP